MSLWSEGDGLALDLDGTLLDSEQRQVELMASLVAPRKEEAVRERFWRLKREGASSEMALVRLGFEADAARTLAAAWTEAVEDERWLALDRPLPGVMETLRGLAAAGVRPAIVTARHHADRVRAQLEALDMTDLVGQVKVVSPADIESQKAEVLAGLAAAYVGDTERDATAARRAGARFAAVATGQRSPEFLRARGVEPWPTLADALAALC